jgi:hypothetical protein
MEAIDGIATIEVVSNATGVAIMGRQPVTLAGNTVCDNESNLSVGPAAAVPDTEGSETCSDEPAAGSRRGQPTSRERVSAILPSGAFVRRRAPRRDDVLDIEMDRGRVVHASKHPVPAIPAVEDAAEQVEHGLVPGAALEPTTAHDVDGVMPRPADEASPGQRPDPVPSRTALEGATEHALGDSTRSSDREPVSDPVAALPADEEAAVHALDDVVTLASEEGSPSHPDDHIAARTPAQEIAVDNGAGVSAAARWEGERAAAGVPFGREHTDG